MAGYRWSWPSAGSTMASALRRKKLFLLDRWSHVAFTYDGSRLASGIHLYLNGKPAPVKVNLDYLNQPFDVKEPLRIGAGFGPANRFKGRIADFESIAMT